MAVCPKRWRPLISATFLSKMLKHREASEVVACYFSSYSKSKLLLATLTSNGSENALAESAGKLGNAGININHGYTGAEEGSKKQLVVFAVSDPKQAGKVLK